MAKGKYQKWLEHDGLLLLRAWARQGLTDEQIANNMEISRETFYAWKKKYTDISDALKKGKEIVDTMVENALLKRALGYDFEEVTEELMADTGQKARHDQVQPLREEEWAMCLAYFDNQCAYCGSQGKLTKDHLDPLDNGGMLEFQNVVPACGACNSSKKNNQWLAWYQGKDFYDKDRARKIMDYVGFAARVPKRAINHDLVITKKVTKHMAPDTTAQIFWLKNRRPDLWRDVNKLDVTGAIVPIIFEGEGDILD